MKKRHHAIASRLHRLLCGITRRHDFQTMSYAGYARDYQICRRCRATRWRDVDGKRERSYDMTVQMSRWNERKGR